MKYIHLKCLKAWIKQRVEVKETPCITSIVWKSLNCELCGSPYPFAVEFNGRIHELISYKIPAPPYAIFEHYNKEEDNSCGISIVKFTEKPIIRIVSNIHIQYK